MHKLLKITGSLAIAGILCAGIASCSKDDKDNNPVAPVVNTTFNFSVSSAPVNSANAHLQTVDLITYTASGGETVNNQASGASLAWSTDATVTAGSGAGMSISYSTSLVDPTTTTLMANTQFTMTIKKDGTTVKTETVTLTYDNPQHSINWTE